MTASPESTEQKGDQPYDSHSTWQTPLNLDHYPVEILEVILQILRSRKEYHRPRRKTHSQPTRST